MFFLNVALIVLVAYFIWVALGMIAGILGIYKDENGDVRWSPAVALGYIVTLGVVWELWSWASDKWGGAFVLGYLVGIAIFLIIPISVLIAAARKL